MAYVNKLVVRGDLEACYPNKNSPSQLLVHDVEHLNMGGFIDAVIKYQGVWYLLEIKSKDDAYKWPPGRDISHIRQLNAYLWMSRHTPDVPTVNEGFVIYVGLGFHGDERCKRCKGGKKTRLAFKESFFEFDQGIHEWMERKCQANENYMSTLGRSTMPPKTNRPYFYCVSCDVKPVCDKDVNPHQAGRET